ncbi:HlyU family transcriptional regulator [Microvirga sp. ACRRW]|uniref:HlyU family transcriptional regulator n=1 Tax=Microvirga sp. ACRRW TaxID=2918205 RepID=UPI001EF59B6C|nr:HlyU family transcriptional regulator [Microvirga sp. ACRRW]MCG7393471.1 HlyU family transcriptional regulator [Microvirga sp. ACRRW]
MVSFLGNLWTRLTGQGERGDSGKTAAEAIEYKGFRIRPNPYPSKGQYQTAGTIEKDFETGVKEHHFVRAETHASKDDAAAFAIVKGRQIIDEQGERIFD